MVTANAEATPQALVDQLAVDGIMLLPRGPHDGAQHLVKLTVGKDGVTEQELLAVRFVPLLAGQAREL
jgi:protein-L-isoaspartate(D-aspartate) O-methyltransferase